MGKPVVVTETRAVSIEHDFRVGQKQWELNVFSVANLFTVAGYHGRGTRTRQEFGTLPEAIEAASQSRRCCVYAISPAGRHIILDKKDWPIWLERYQAREEART